MTRTTRNRPSIETLEGRALLSVAPVPGATNGAAIIEVRPAQHRLALSGTIQGVWSRELTNPDIGGVQTLRGSGRVRPLMMVDANGTLHTPGFVAQGTTTGSLTLAGARGSVTLELAGAMPQPGFSGPPSTLRYTIVRGTGRYAHATGSGTADLLERPEREALPGPPGTSRPDYVIAPSFTLVLHA